MFGYIYKTTNLINKKVYIGQHKSCKFDKNYFGSGVILLKSIKKYGINNFKCEIIEECSSQEELNKEERFWIKTLKPEYNISEGGNGGNLGLEINRRISETIKRKWKDGSISHHSNSGFQKGYTPWNKGTKGLCAGWHHSEETKLKLSKLSKGRCASEEQRLNHSRKMKGHFVSSETRRKMSINNAMKNPLYREKARINRIKNLKKKHWITDETINRLIPLEDVENYLNQGWRIGRNK